MGREAYFSALRETGLDVTPHILRAIQSLGIKADALRDSVMFFARRRLSKPLLKPALMRFAYELCGGRDWARILPACAAFELLNISSYQANSAFDEKLGILSRNEKDAQFMASMLTREAAMLSAAMLCESFPPLAVSRVQLALSESNRSICVAQHYDLHRLTLHNYASYLDEHKYLHEYTLRCHYGSGIFNGLCAFAGALLAGADAGALECLQEFGTHFGTALQMANDLGDLVPPEEPPLCGRAFQDQGSDLRNGRLTLPVYVFVKRMGMQACVEAKQSLKDNDRRSDSLATIARAFAESGSVDAARNEIRRHAKRARNCLADFSHAPAKSHLLTMVSGTLSNKYFAAFRKFCGTCRNQPDFASREKVRRKQRRELEVASELHYPH